MRSGTVGTGFAAAALIVPAPAAAEPVYFHKPAVERSAFEADLGECVSLAGGVRVEPSTTYNANLYAAAATAFLAGFMNSRLRRKMTRNVLRTCMIDKGYRRVEASEGVTRELRRMSDGERAERLFTLAAAPEPEGTLLPP